MIGEKWVILFALLLSFLLTIYLMLVGNPMCFFTGLMFGYLLSRSKDYKYPFEK